LLEIILNRDQHVTVRQYIETSENALAISALTGHLIVHFGVKIVRMPIIKQFLSDYEFYSLTAQDFEWAFTNIRGNDFEDALQIAVAVRNGCSKFVTLDKDLIKNYKDLTSIKVIHPS